MKQKEFVIEEYRALRQEILQLFRQAHHLILLGLTSSGFILGYIFSTNSTDWQIFVLPILILFACVLAITERINHAWAIGRYIQIFLENGTGFAWETAWERFRTIETKNTVFTGILNRLFSFPATSSIPLILVQIVCIVYAEQNNMPWYLFILFGLMIAFQSILILYAERGIYLKNRFKKIKNDLFAAD